MGACITTKLGHRREKAIFKAKKVAGLTATLTRLEGNQSVSNTVGNRKQTKAGQKPVAVHAHCERMKKKDRTAFNVCHSVGSDYCSDCGW